MAGKQVPRQVLLVIHTGTFFVELIRLARLLVADGRYTPTLIFYPQPTADRDARLAEKDGIRAYSISGRSMNFLSSNNGGRDSSHTRSLGLMSKVRWKLGSMLRWSNLYELTYQYMILSSCRRRIRRMLHRYRPAAVVLGGDMVGYDTSVWVQAGHAAGSPVVIVPSTMSNGLEQAEVYFDDPRHGFGSWMNRLVARKHPQWVFEHKGRRLLRERGARALVMEGMDLAPDKPWIFNSGRADAIALESEAMKAYYMDAGLEGDRLVVTGSPSDDRMAEVFLNQAERRQQLLLELGLPGDRPTLLTALPPNFLGMPGGRPQCDFSRYDELVSFWMGALNKIQGVNKLIALHPSVQMESMRHLEGEETRIACLPTAELVPLCDVFVASVSSTIRWAIACGKPVVNYDVYRYRYTDYVEVPGVLATEEQEEYAALVERLALDDAFRSRVADMQDSVAAQWGRMDGCAGERVTGLISDLVMEYSRAGKP